MAEALNDGVGRCLCTARTLIRPTRSALELGAGVDVVHAALNAVHHANRQGDPEDFLGIALPTMKMGRNGMASGFEIEVFGSEKSLSALLGLEGVERLLRRAAIAPAEINEAVVDAGDVGAAYVRDRIADKYTPGWVRRNRKRAEKRGVKFEFDKPFRQHDGRTVAISFGTSVVCIREVVGTMNDHDVLVSTFGLSSSTSPAFLPVTPISAGIAHAA